MQRSTLSGNAPTLAALELFLDRGYAATTLTAVAEASGLARGALSRRFATKELLLSSIVAALLDDLDELVAGVDLERSGTEDHVFVLADYLDTLLRHRRAARVLLSDSGVRSSTVWQRSAAQHRLLVARLAGRRASISQQVRANCSLSVLRLCVSELWAVPAHRLRQPLLEVALETCAQGGRGVAARAGGTKWSGRTPDIRSAAPV